MCGLKKNTLNSSFNLASEWMLNSSTDTSKLVRFVEFLPMDIFPLAFWFTNMWEIKRTKPAENRISESENYKCKRRINNFVNTLLYFSIDYARSNPLIIKVYAIYWMRRIVIAQNPNYLGTTCCMFINCNIINANTKPTCQTILLSIVNRL